MDSFEALRALALAILSKPHEHDWTVQGFGMLRMYPNPGNVFQLNIWHPALAVPGVSVIHTHPWHFESLVLAGRFVNRRYIPYERGVPYLSQDLITGENAKLQAAPVRVGLTLASVEFYKPGESYQQRADEIHETGYSPGSVTINKRVRVYSDIARVFWPDGQQWVDAATRRATIDEIRIATEAAVRNLENGV